MPLERGGSSVVGRGGHTF